MTQPLLNISARKVGGIRFLKLGRINVSLSISRPKVEAAAPRFYVRPTLCVSNGLTLAGLRLYRNGKLAAIQWCTEGFHNPVEAWSHAQLAAQRSGLPRSR